MEQKSPEFLEKIKNWTASIKNLDQTRRKNNLNLLFDINPVENFEVSFLKTERKSEEEVKDGFIKMYSEFSKRIVDSAIYESGSFKVSEDFTSISRMLYLMDQGFDIFSEILSETSMEKLRIMVDISKPIYDAFNILVRKRLAVFRLIDPFDSIWREIELEHKWKHSGLEALVLLGFATSKEDEDKYWEKENKLQNLKVSGISRYDIKDLVFDFIEEKKTGFTLKEFKDELETIFKKLKEIAPGVDCTILDKEYYKDKEMISYKIKLNEETLTLTVPYSSLPKEILQLLNTHFLEKFDKEVVLIQGLGRNLFIWVDSDLAEKIKKNAFMMDIEDDYE